MAQRMIAVNTFFYSTKRPRTVGTSKNTYRTTKTVFYSIGTIVAMNVATVINIYGFPSEAFYGLTSVSLYGIALVVF